MILGFNLAAKYFIKIGLKEQENLFTVHEINCDPPTHAPTHPRTNEGYLTVPSKQRFRGTIIKYGFKCIGLMIVPLETTFRGIIIFL